MSPSKPSPSPRPHRVRIRPRTTPTALIWSATLPSFKTASSAPATITSPWAARSAPTYNTLITNCTFGYGHGVSIGSGTTDGVTNLTVINCTFNNTDNGIRMKSDSGKGGNAQYLYYYNLSMTNITYAPIIIYSYYNTYGNPTTAGITPAIAAGEATASTSGEPV